MKDCGTTEECQLIINTQCNYLKSPDYFQMSDAWDNSVWFKYIIYGSSLMYALLAFFICKIKKLQVHPNQLNMYIMICNSIVLWSEAAHN